MYKVKVLIQTSFKIRFHQTQTNLIELNFVMTFHRLLIQICVMCNILAVPSVLSLAWAFVSVPKFLNETQVQIKADIVAIVTKYILERADAF